MSGGLPPGALRKLFREAALIGRPETAERVAKYRLIREIASGAMGTVYEAEDVELKRPVAVKILRDLPGSVEIVRRRFQREAQSAARLLHPNVVQVYGAGEEQGRSYLVMELVQGRALSEILPRGGRDLRPLVVLLEKAARGVAAAHAAGIVHRDLKPANILVAVDGTPKVGDFGLAHWLGQETAMTATGIPLGTPVYMSPEQVRGEAGRISPATDVYALGAILYEIATGRPPHSGSSTAEVYSRIMADDPSSPRRLNASMDADLETICLKALEKDPSRRYRDAAEFADELKRQLAGEPILARPVSTLGRGWRRILRRRATLVPAAAALAAIAGIAAVALRSAAVERERARRVEDQAAAREAEAARREERRREALRLLEAARPALDKVFRLRYDAKADGADIVRQVEEIRPRIERAVALSPETAMGHFLLGRAWEGQGWMEKAETCWREAIRLDPAFGPAHFQLARLLAFRSFTEIIVPPDRDHRAPERPALEAVAELEAARAAGSGFDEPLQRDVNAAMLAMALNDHARTFELCTKGAATWGKAVGAEDFHWLLGYLYTGADRLQAFDRAVELCPKHPWALYGRGVAREWGGDRAGAIADFTEATRANPRLIVAFDRRANLRREAGDVDGSDADYGAILEIDPKCLEAWFNRANSRAERRDWAGALADYDQALKIRPVWAAALTYRALAKINLGDAAGAIRDCDAAAPIDPTWFKVPLHRAGARERLGDADGAFRDYSEAIRLKPDDPRAYAARAVVLRDRGDYHEAEADLLKCLALPGGDWPQRPYALAMLREIREKLEK